MASAASSTGGVGAGATGGGVVGAALLTVGAGEAAMVEALSEWSKRVDASLVLMSVAFSDLRTEVMGTQVALVATVQEAKVALGGMHEGFRAALETQHHPAWYYRSLGL